MKKYQIKYMEDTVKDRAQIKAYLKNFYPSTPKKFFTKLKKEAARLKQFPYSCRAYEDDPDYRVLVVGDYLVFYIVDEDAKFVEIHRIFHGSWDISKQMSGS